MAPLARLRLRERRRGERTATAERKEKTLSIPASIQRIGGPGSGEWRLAVKTEDFVGGIHFSEVLAQQDATREVRTGDAVARIAEREQVVRKVAVRADARQAVRRYVHSRPPSRTRGCRPEISGYNVESSYIS